MFVGRFSPIARQSVRLAGRQTTRLTRLASFQAQGVPPRRKSTWFRTFLISIGSVSALGFVAWWFYWPHHTFPSSVAKILRKGLWAESKRGNNDYKEALKYYLEALKEADRLKLDPLSDEYTGVQLKVAEMFEKMSLTQDALMIYSEIASGYLTALTTPGRVPDSVRPHMIQKDLRTVIKITQLNKGDPNVSKMLLMTHFLIAQEEVAKKNKIARKLINREHKTVLRGDEDSPFVDHQEKELDLSNESALNIDDQKHLEKLFKNRQAWEPFRDELFNARDLYGALCLATGDMANAVRTKIATTEWMLNADCDPGEILFSQTNLGSLMYLQAEEFEIKEQHAEKVKAAANVIKSNKEQKEKCFELATKCYESVLNFSKQLPVQLRRDQIVEESIALSTYGLGVVNLHRGDLSAAKNLLREARLRAKGSGFTDLVTEAENELDKLDKEAALLEQQQDAAAQLPDEPIEFDVQIAKTHH